MQRGRLTPTHGTIGDLLNDPPGFDRAETFAVDRKVSAFFKKHLLR